MYRFIKSITLGVSLALVTLWCVPTDANADTRTIYKRFTIASATVWGGVPVAAQKGDNFSPLALKSDLFTVPLTATKIKLLVHLPDTLYGAGTLTDTIHVGLETKASGLYDSAYNDWIVCPSSGAIGRVVLVGVATKPLGAGMCNFYDGDSTSAMGINRVYNAGEMRFSLWGPANDTVSDAAINVDCYLIFDDGR